MILVMIARLYSVMVMEVNLRASIGKTKVTKKDAVTPATVQNVGDSHGLLGPTRRICLV